MKKNVMMRVASVMLVLVLMTSSVISGTFAKYTTQDAGSDEARVAKWGVELQVIGNLYGDTYKDQIVRETADSGANIRVQSIDQADVVAPGTKNAEGFTFSLNGQPEVDGIVTTTMKIQNIFLKKGTYGVMIPVDGGVVTKENFDEFEGDLYTVDAAGVYTKLTDFTDGTPVFTLEDKVEFYEDYYPVVYALKDKTVGSYNGDSLKKAADAIATQLGLTAEDPAAYDTSITYTGKKEFNANTNLAGWDVDAEVLTWEWAFGEIAKDGDVGDKPTDAAWTDGADTILGNLMTAKLNGGTVVEGKVVKMDGSNYKVPTEYTDYCLNTQFAIDITVTQVD